MSALLLLWVIALPGQDLQRYGLVTLNGADTVSVERVTRRPGELESRVLVPGRARLVVKAGLDGDGCVRRVEEDVFPWGSGEAATPLQHVAVRLEGDSVRVEIRAGDVERSAVRPAAGAEFVLVEEAMAAAAQIVECASARGDSTDLVVVANPGVRLLTVPVRRKGGEVMVVTSDTSRVVVGSDGIPERIELGSGAVVLRVAVEDLDVAAPAVSYEAPDGASYRAEDVRIPVSGTTTLAGTLTLPADARGPVPGVVLLSGSGPQDRDSFAPIGDGWRPFREVADVLSSRGVAVLRFDDRGVGSSTGDFAAGTERTEAEDARAALAFLRARPDIAGDRLALLGHSEGARVAMLVAAADADLAGLILMAGAADPRAAVRAQALWTLEHDPAAAALSKDSVMAQVDRQMDSLAVSGKREVFRWDAAGLARTTTAAVAILQGATDHQVPANQADALAGLFRAAGNEDVTVRVFPGVNHLFVGDESGDFLRYRDLSSARLEPSVLEAIADWVDARLTAPGPRSRYQESGNRRSSGRAAVVLSKYTTTSNSAGRLISAR